MKYAYQLCLGLFFLASFYVRAQQTAKQIFINTPGTSFQAALSGNNQIYGDSLNGFDEAGEQVRLLGNGIYGQEYLSCITYLKRAYINQKYNLSIFQAQQSTSVNHLQNTAARPIGGNNTVNTAPCINEDFEATVAGQYYGSGNATAISGWTLTSMLQSDGLCAAPNFTLGSPEAWIVNTPINSVTGIGTLGNSPLGGSKVIQLGDNSPSGLKTKLMQTFPVTSNNTFFQFAFAAVLQDGGHSCCSSPIFNVQAYDCQGTIIACDVVNFYPTGAACTVPGQNVGSYSSITTTQYGNLFYSNWQTRYVDLTAYIGTCVTIEFIAGDCTATGHFGFCYIDAHCDSQVAGTAINELPPVSNAISFCPGATQAVLQAPAGYSYQWASSTGTIAGATAQSFTVTSPVVGDVYRAILTSSAGCSGVNTFSLVNSTISIASVSTTPSCPTGATGSATVTGAGSSAGYNYLWLDASNTFAGASQVFSGVQAGIYTASVSATSGCGSATIAVTIGTAVPITNTVANYCGTFAFLSAPSAGSGYQWYHGSSLIAGSTASDYTVSPAFNGDVYWLSYQSSNGCKDSVKYVLAQNGSGNLNINTGVAACPGTSTATAVVSLSNTGTNSGNNAFYFSSVGNTPAYSSSVTGTSALFYSAYNLSATGAYSVVAFDGSCYYGTTFTMIPSVPPFTYTLSQTNATVCAGQSLSVSLSMQNATQYTYYWSPAGSVNNPTLSHVVISPPSGAAGYTGTSVYTITVRPTSVNCPQTQTVAVTSVNPLTPTLAGIPALCTNSPDYTISVNPPGGIFQAAIGGPISQIGGVIQIALTGVGVHNYTYTTLTGTCAAFATGSYSVLSAPSVNVSGNATICRGELITLNATGADSYVWNTTPPASGSSLAVSPLNTSIYSVMGTNDQTGCSSAKTTTVTVAPCTGIYNSNLDGQLKIYPNPAVNELTIESPESVAVTLYSQLGAMIFESKLQKGVSVIDLSSYSSGIYLLKTSSDAGVKITKVIKTQK